MLHILVEIIQYNKIYTIVNMLFFKAKKKIKVNPNLFSDIMLFFVPLKIINIINLKISL